MLILQFNVRNFKLNIGYLQICVSVNLDTQTLSGCSSKIRCIRGLPYYMYPWESRWQVSGGLSGAL